MKLLFDQNVSPKLVKLLSDIYPKSAHVHGLGLDKSADNKIWEYAGKIGYTIVSKDSDFIDLSWRYGFPPKIISIRRGNCSTSQIEKLLRRYRDNIEAFQKDETTGNLLLF
ncbi:MAG TPA: DUF5615 family PIN-like protein [Salinimicrobium sp.]|nr:DUF5615 family PIN-like protein [Salinimicrobium sp.]